MVYSHSSFIKIFWKTSILSDHFN